MKNGKRNYCNIDKKINKELKEKFFQYCKINQTVD